MSVEQLESNYNVYCKLVDKCGDRAPKIRELIETLGERLIMCPGHDRREKSTAKPGGLIEHSLNVVKTMKSLEAALNLGVSQESLFLVGLLHDIGRVGSLDADYYLPQSSDWHRDKAGILYVYNPDLPKMPHNHRSLALLQTAGISLSYEEWIAIATSGGPTNDENKFYVGGELPLTLLTQTATRIVQTKEKIQDT